jgi:hypothetical protein
MAYSRPQGDAPNPAVVDLIFAKVPIRGHTPSVLLCGGCVASRVV